MWRKESQQVIGQLRHAAALTSQRLEAHALTQVRLSCHSRHEFTLLFHVLLLFLFMSLPCRASYCASKNCPFSMSVNYCCLSKLCWREWLLPTRSSPRSLLALQVWIRAVSPMTITPRYEAALQSSITDVAHHLQHETEGVLQSLAELQGYSRVILDIHASIAG